MPSRGRTFSRVRDLLLRNVEGTHLDAVVARHVQRQRAPPATRPRRRADPVEALACGRRGRAWPAAPVPAWPPAYRSTHRCRPFPRRATGGRSRCPGRSGAGCVAAIPVLVFERGRGSRPSAVRLPRDRTGTVGGSIAAREHIDEITLDLDAPRTVRISESEFRTDDDREQRASIAKDDASMAFARRAIRIFVVP